MITKYLILGAGLAGLSAAYHIKEGCGDWIILEASDRGGGLCKSLQYDDGFTFDHSIHILYSSDAYASELIKKLLNGNMIVQKRESWVYSYGTYTPYPWQANTYGLPPEIVKKCLIGLIRTIYEKNGRQKPQNFKEWCYSTFGEGFAEHFMIPYNSKLWAIGLEKMTDVWIRDRVMTPDLEDVIEGALNHQDKAFGPNAVFWYPEREGIEALPRGFLSNIDQKRIFCNTMVTRVMWKERKVISADGKEWRYSRLISSLPLPVLLGYMEPLVPPELKDASGRLECNIVYAINLKVRNTNLPPYHWIYFPEEQYIFHRISFPGNFSTSMVPDGWSSITVEVSASKYRKVPTADALIKKVVEGLMNACIISNTEDITVKSVLTLNPAYVIYNHTHRNDVDRLHQFLRENGIYPCGRFGEWEYLNMDHSILSGKMAIEQAE